MAKSKKMGDKLDISAMAIVDNMVFTKNDVYAYYRLTNKMYDFVSVAEKYNIGAGLNSAFAYLMSDRVEDLQGHIILSTVPVDVKKWEEQMNFTTENRPVAPGFDRFMNDQLDFLLSQEFRRRVSYVGIHLGTRSSLGFSDINVIEAGVKGAADSLSKWWKNVFKMPEGVTPDEEERFRRIESDFSRKIAFSALHGSRATSEEILLMMKRLLYPAMPTPYLDIDHSSRAGRGDIELEMASLVNRKRRWVEFNQLYEGHEMTGYKATLTVAKLPKEVYFPSNSPLMLMPSSMGFPFTTFSRFNLVSAEKMKGILAKKRKEQKDEVDNSMKGMTDVDAVVGGMPEDTVAALQEANLIAQLTQGNRDPWVHAWYRIVIEAETEEQLKDIGSSMISEYKNLGITLRWTGFDQNDLFLESMPGDHVRSTSFRHVATLPLLSTSGFGLGENVGDKIYGEIV